MTAPKVRADYDPLQTIAQQFDQQAHAIQQTLRQIQDALNTLQQGDWVGAGANQFYAEMARVERWSVRTLRQKIQGMLYERTAISRKPEELARAELEALQEEDLMTPDLVFRDPYLLDFLGLEDPTASVTWRRAY